MRRRRNEEAFAESVQDARGAHPPMPNTGRYRMPAAAQNAIPRSSAVRRPRWSATLPAKRRPRSAKADDEPDEQAGDEGGRAGLFVEIDRQHRDDRPETQHSHKRGAHNAPDLGAHL